MNIDYQYLRPEKAKALIAKLEESAAAMKA